MGIPIWFVKAEQTKRKKMVFSIFYILPEEPTGRTRTQRAEGPRGMASGTSLSPGHDGAVMGFPSIACFHCTLSHANAAPKLHSSSGVTPTGAFAPMPATAAATTPLPLPLPAAAAAAIACDGMYVTGGGILAGPFPEGTRLAICSLSKVLYPFTLHSIQVQKLFGGHIIAAKRSPSSGRRRRPYTKR